MTATRTGNKTRYMALALEQAEAAARAGEVPVGAVLVDPASGTVLARAHNLVETQSDPTAHAELLVIRAAAAELGAKRLTSADTGLCCPRFQNKNPATMGGGIAPMASAIG